MEPVRAPPYELHDVEKSPTPDMMYTEDDLPHTPSVRSVTSEPEPEYDDPNWDEEGEWLEDDSPYPEVRSAVANFDDPTMPVSTLRAWALGVCFAIVMPALNQFFDLRYPSILVGPLVAQLIAFPLGRFWARFVPQVRIFGLSLNPGPFNIKEHVLVTIMAGVGAQSAYSNEIVAAQRVFYHQNFNFAYQWTLVISTQLIGFSAGGLTRRLLVAPASMIWPNTLVVCALFNTLHSQNYVGFGNRSGMSRERFFTYALFGSTVWYFVPGYLFSALSMFTWVCWIAPRNVKLNVLFGYRSGMGFSLLTLDWNQIALIGSPLATPWWAEANVVVGFIFFYWILTPVLYVIPEWWYVLQCSVYHIFEANLRHSVIVALLIALFFIVPVGMIEAVTTRQVGLNVITELIAGYILPGRPVAMMLFKTFGYISMSQGILFTQDFKLGHYMKIPPRSMFCAQVVATVIAGTVQLGVLSWMFSTIPHICGQEQADMWVRAPVAKYL
ncbi:hypothetical protein EUX98_g8179 [Antrodiella citrinella]|uniref:OPT family small oligopeptide transporter n=1 Tax=Antrodiella citrinella TaxID=2447956 RepID=A0A4S4MAP2_9APHY|nr:hypothetical protein EUX98_g8179 [Antrodiella citrinella]